MKKFRKKGIRIIAIILAALLVLSVIAMAFSASAVSLENTETYTTIEQTTDVVTDVHETELETDAVIETEVTTDIPTEPPAASITQQKKDKYQATFSLYNIKKADEVIVTLKNIENSKNKIKLEFTEDNNFFVVIELPVGTYEIEKIKTNSKYIKVEFDIEEVNIKENDLQNFTIDCSETESGFIVQFLGRNWFFLLALGALLIAYKRVTEGKKEKVS